MAVCPKCKTNLTETAVKGGRCPACGQALPASEQSITSTVQAVDLSGLQSLEPAAEASEASASDVELVAEGEGSRDGPPCAVETEPSSESGTDTADQARISQTLPPDSGGPAGPTEREKGTADEERIAATFQFADAASPSVPEREKGTSDEKDIAMTLQMAGMTAPPNVPTEGAADKPRLALPSDSGTVPETPGPQHPLDSDSHRFAQTIESDTHSSDPALADSHRYAETFDSGEISGDLGSRVSMVWPSKFEDGATPRTSIKAETQSIEEESNLVIQPRVLCEVGARGDVKADYELLSELGKGGMGIVHNARQASIDRTVALKKIKPEKAKDAEARRTFLSEAVVTGDLEHPNIVPIYDLGRDESGVLFYSMKRVKGTPWDKVFVKKTFEENLEIWMKIADAVAFAHSRGVVHRDLKPENVMLGDFGEVLLMDWGLALVLDSPSAKKAGMAGTPAYMPPEMAIGPVDRIGLGSDIYLMGAILYEVITGITPHTGPTVTACLLAAARNEIQPAAKSGELVDIALKSMATRPEDRYASVVEFQDAIRQYRSHSESISLSTRADDDLEAAAGREDYESYAKALFGFQEAHELWDGNIRAKEGILETTLAYGRRALEKGDYQMGLSLLDEGVPEHIPLLEELRAARREQDARQRRLKTAKRIGAALVATVLIVVTGAAFFINNERNKAKRSEETAIGEKIKADKAKEDALAAEKVARDEKGKADKAKEDALAKKKEADDARKVADTAKNEALDQKNKADEARRVADTAKNDALAKKKEAEDAKNVEENEAYIAKIGLAAAKIEENAFDRARTVLDECPERLRNFEWGRLDYLCNLAKQRVPAEQPIEAVAYSPDGKRFATGGWGGTVSIWNAVADKKDHTAAETPLRTIATGGTRVFTMAFSPDGRYLATGTNDVRGFVKTWDAANGSLVKTFVGHSDAVVSLAYSQDGRWLLTGSYDATARLWDMQGKQSSLLPKSHRGFIWSVGFAPVPQGEQESQRKVPAANRRQLLETHIVTASQDGSVIVWTSTSVTPAFKPEKAFLGHIGPVFSAVYSPDGAFVASAGNDKRVLLWRPKDVEVSDWDVFTEDPEALSKKYEVLKGHAAGISALRFTPDGQYLASAGHDNAVCIWNVKDWPAPANLPSGRLYKTLRGHGGRMRALDFRITASSPQAPGVQPQLIAGLAPRLLAKDPPLLSGSYDQTARTWYLKDHAEVRAFLVRPFEGHQDAVLGAAFSPDGQSFVSASRDRTARAWDVSTGARTEFQQGHEYMATTAIFFRDGKRVLTSDLNDSTRVWDCETGTNIVSLLGTGSSDAAALCCGETRILTSGGKIDDALIRSSGGKLTAADSGTYAAQLWDWDAKQGIVRSPERYFTGHDAEVTAVAVSPDDRIVFTGDNSGRCRLWDMGGAPLLNDPRGHPRGLRAAIFLAKGDRLVTASSDGTIVVWDVPARKRLRSVTLSQRAAVTSLAFSSDGRHATTTCAERKTAADRTTYVEGHVRLWDLENGAELAILTKNETFNAVQYSSDNRWIVATSFKSKSSQNKVRDSGDIKEYAVRVLDSQTLKEAPDNLGVLRAINISANKSKSLGQRGVPMVWSAVFSPQQNCLLTVGGDEARLWDAKTGLEKMAFSRQGAVTSARYSPDRKWVVTGSTDYVARIWDVATGRPVRKLDGRTGLEGKPQGHEHYVNDAVFSPDGKYIATASEDKTAKLWDRETGKLLHTFKGHSKSVRSVVFHQTAQEMKLLVASGEKVRIWNVKTQKEVTQVLDVKAEEDKTNKAPPKLKRHTQDVLCAAISPDGTRILTGGEDNVAIVWAMKDGAWEAKLRLEGHTAAVTSVMFSPDGSRAITGSKDDTAKIWELEEKLRSLMVEEAKKRWFDANTTGAAEGLRQAVADLQRAQRGKELLTLKGHSQEVTTVAFSPDEKNVLPWSVLTGGMDGSVIVWPANDWRPAPRQNAPPRQPVASSP